MITWTLSVVYLSWFGAVLRMVATNIAGVTGDSVSPGFDHFATSDYRNNDFSTAITPDYVILQSTCLATSCEGKCGTDFDIWLRPCSCHRRCVDYFDCCPDYHLYCLNDDEDTATPTSVSQASHHPRSLCAGNGCYSCSSYFANSFDDTKNTFHAVGRCPVSYPDVRIKDHCNNPDSDKLVDTLPVYQHDGAALYKNVYCAVCHGTPLEQIVQFQAGISCPDNATVAKEYFLSLPFTLITYSEMAIYQCVVRIGGPLNISFTGKPCIAPDIGLCPDGHRLAENCRAFLEPLKVTIHEENFRKIEITARNRFCHECSDYNLMRSRCWTPISTFSVGTELGNLRFSILFDFTSEFSDENTKGHLAEMTNNDDQPNLDLNQKYQFLNGTSVTLFLNISGELRSNTRINIIESIFQRVEYIFPSLVDKELTTTSRDSCTTSTNISCVVTSFALRASLSNPERRYMGIVQSLRGVINVHAATEMLNLSHLTLSNIDSAMDVACSSKPLSYTPQQFGRVLSEGEDKGTDRVTFPLEVTWMIYPENTTRIEAQYSRNDTEKYSETYFGCGRLSSCNIQVYTAENVKHLNNIKNVTQIRALDSALFINNDILVCSEELQRLVDSQSLVAEDSVDMVEILLTVIGCILSLTGLLITFITYLLFPDLRNLPGKCAMNLVLSIFLAQSLFILGGLVSWRDDNVCLVTAICQHFFWLASFSWTNVMAFDLGRTFGGSQSPFVGEDKSKRYWLYFLLAWILPLLVVLICVCLDMLTPISIGYGVNRICWIAERRALLLAFIVPVSIHLIFNIVLFSYVVLSIYRIRQVTKRVQTNNNRRNALVIYTRISAVMGFTWLLGYLANVFPVPVVWYAFTVLNAGQGVYLFIAFVLTPSVITRYKALCCGSKGDLTNSSMTRTGPNTLSTASIGEPAQSGQ